STITNPSLSMMLSPAVNINTTAVTPQLNMVFWTFIESRLSVLNDLYSSIAAYTQPSICRYSLVGAGVEGGVNGAAIGTDDSIDDSPLLDLRADVAYAPQRGSGSNWFFGSECRPTLEG